MLPCFVDAAIQLGAGKKPINFHFHPDDKDSLLAVQRPVSKLEGFISRSCAFSD